jgi:hypothetical protein
LDARGIIEKNENPALSLPLCGDCAPLKISASRASRAHVDTRQAARKRSGAFYY